MEGILADENIMMRIKTGAKQARERKGRFVSMVAADSRQGSY
jgi:hypothetical protein